MSRRPLRVLYVNHLGVLGGAERSLLGLIEHLNPRHIEPFLAAPSEGLLAPAAQELQIPYYPVPSCRLRRPTHPWDYVKSFFRFQQFVRALRRIIRLVQPELIHANSLIAAWAAVTLAKLPVIWHCRDLQAPAALMQRVRQKAAFVIAISHAVAAFVQKNAPHGAPLTVIYNGFSPRDVHITRRRSQIRAEWELGPDTPLVGCMGQLVPWKKQDVLLQAFPYVLQHIPEARLIICGEDYFSEHTDYVRHLHELAEKLDIAPQIIWAGFVSQPANVLAALDVLAHPAEGEPFGRVILEALALGVPVVAINQAGPAEIIEDGQSGLLVPPRQPKALAEAITRILQDAELRFKLSSGALIRARRFSAQHTAARVTELYFEVHGA